MIKKSQQINKIGVKKQENKDTKKKVVNKDVVWECLCCGKKVIATEKPTTCPCSNNNNYVVNKSYEVV